MGGRGDPGVVMTARVLPLAVLVFSRYSDTELARYRGTLTELAHDAEVSDQQAHDSLLEGLQGLGGLTILGGLLSAIFIWASQHMAYVPMSVLTAMSTGLMGFAGTLAAIYGARLTWRRPALRPRRVDFWLAVAPGLLITAGVLAGRLTV
ncbi:UDP-N-acetylmuramyl pentapeptide phosphotransferase/UDP-N-acetylglucosamine-1-phosphate transferase [Kibdelosporangium banguiense]|uniref:UDP-N-acetylmuramyl pentapeptide phosphotransferase/UDP-N-acetylglucosamine-1-phosphate transferase n=1 Tax=Kibdelosporangium banguiense TaxID=1365924 RepID=A0ABS4TUD4_9PSEU|nr:hypothetical protein [Kibdelosporangium banguiense]MBP2328024.1 UDP-N-acetylmuramyl pentapeptide phosphotransferase/UDP-N-acetylglucosamine-1-phosphate transferase [Kibdelosporangium banguiense]